MFALIRTDEYFDRVLSRHRTEQAAESAEAKLLRAIRRRHGKDCYIRTAIREYGKDCGNALKDVLE